MISTGDQAQIIGTGVGAFLIFGTGVFKAANMRGDLNAKWSPRVDVARGALQEKTVVALRELRDQLNEALPVGELFLPLDVSMDPGPLAEKLELTTHTYEASKRMETDLSRLRDVGRFMAGALIGLMLATVLITLWFSRVAHSAWVLWPGCVLGGIATLLLGAASGLYFKWSDRLASDEILAETASQANMGGEE